MALCWSVARKEALLLAPSLGSDLGQVTHAFPAPSVEQRHSLSSFYLGGTDFETRGPITYERCSGQKQKLPHTQELLVNFYHPALQPSLSLSLGFSTNLRADSQKSLNEWRLEACGGQHPLSGDLLLLSLTNHALRPSPGPLGFGFLWVNYRLGLGDL